MNDLKLNRSRDFTQFARASESGSSSSDPKLPPSKDFRTCVSQSGVTPKKHTRWGSRILKEIQTNHDAYDVPQRFALYGYQVLSGGTLDDLKQMFKAEAEAEAGGCGCGC